MRNKKIDFFLVIKCVGKMEEKLRILDKHTYSDIFGIICGYFDWRWISQHQTLSEDFIEKHEDSVNWDNISQNQKLSEDFIEKHEDRVNWLDIS